MKQDQPLCPSPDDICIHCDNLADHFDEDGNPVCEECALQDENEDGFDYFFGAKPFREVDEEDLPF